MDPTQLFATRYNVGFAGKDQLNQIVEELKRTRAVQERAALGEGECRAGKGKRGQAMERR